MKLALVPMTLIASAAAGQGPGSLAGSTLCITTAAALQAGAGAISSPPTDEQVAQASAQYNAKIKALQEAGKFNPGLLGPAADEALKGIDIASMSGKQVQSVIESSNLYLYTTRAAEFDQRLATLSAAPSHDGALAAVFRLGFLGSADAAKQRTVIATMLDHPKLAQALADAELWGQLSAFTWFVQGRTIKDLGPKLVSLAPMMPDSMPVLSAMGAVALFDAAVDAGVPAAEREPLRARLVTVLRKTRVAFDPADPTLKNISFGAADAGGHLDQLIRRLDGAVGRGTLVGGPAPELNFIWVCGERPWRSLADLKGKVVVLDFWATWCGPCVASFPKMREVAERYRGYDVEIIGVTSIQGRHTGDGPTVDCKDDPKREMALMADYIKNKEMTWPVAFSSQPVYNGDYGVRGIPHVVLIDAKGNVKHTNLDFHGDLGKLTGAIDAMLSEVGLRVP